MQQLVTFGVVGCSSGGPGATPSGASSGCNLPVPTNAHKMTILIREMGKCARGCYKKPAKYTSCEAVLSTYYGG